MDLATTYKGVTTIFIIIFTPFCFFFAFSSPLVFCGAQPAVTACSLANGVCVLLEFCEKQVSRVGEA